MPIISKFRYFPTSRRNLEIRLQEISRKLPEKLENPDITWKSCWTPQNSEPPGSLEPPIPLDGTLPWLWLVLNATFKIPHDRACDFHIYCGAPEIGTVIVTSSLDPILIPSELVQAVRALVFDTLKEAPVFAPSDGSLTGVLQSIQNIQAAQASQVEITLSKVTEAIEGMTGQISQIRKEASSEQDARDKNHALALNKKDQEIQDLRRWEPVRQLLEEDKPSTFGERVESMFLSVPAAYLALFVLVVGVLVVDFGHFAFEEKLLASMSIGVFIRALWLRREEAEKAKKVSKARRERAKDLAFLGTLAPETRESLKAMWVRDSPEGGNSKENTELELSGRGGSAKVKHSSEKS